MGASLVSPCKHSLSLVFPFCSDLYWAHDGRMALMSVHGAFSDGSGGYSSRHTGLSMGKNVCMPKQRSKSMPLKHDPELKAETDKILDETFLNDKAATRVIMIKCIVFLAVVFGVLEFLSPRHLLVGMMVASTLCLIYVVSFWATIIHASINLVSAASEWVGRKQLGEWEP